MRPFLTLFIFLQITVSSFAQPTLSLNRVIRYLSAPMQLTNAADGTGRIFIVQKGGKVQVYSKTYDSIGVFLTVTGITTNGERGLLSMAFHPDYKNNGFFYVYYTNNSGDLELARYKVSANANVADAASKVILKTIPHPGQSNHNGGELHFGKDSCLYLSTGDGGGAGDPSNNGQNTSSLLGKILRFKVNTSNISPYYDLSANAENPFGNEIFALGLRNPFRWSFDRLTYDMWIGDVGQDSYEEINFRPVDSLRGANYGWRCYEGFNVHNVSSGCGAIGNYIFPTWSYPTQNPSAAITGGTVYRGTTYIDLNGYYVSADYYSGTFYIIKHDTITNKFDTSKQTITPIGLADFGETEDGELYAVCLNNGSVYRVAASGSIHYVFNGNGNWENAANWSNGVIPPLTLPAGSVITINPVENGECILNLTTIQTISPGATLNILSGKKFRIISDLIIQ
ncbi:PQQ-dependent sugar dehydrogenase [Ferruginibacter sp. SUN002]|uniref:PQQ-dependent sugar dehydrogenase n=1 Tax=Ferruginibacter sp. SUN002 TaxID=2937789 RepID=UPI003D36172B